MFDNCKDCMFYDKDRDDLYREYDDEMPLDGSIPDNHFCVRFQSGIAKEVWEHKAKCPYYVKDIPIN